jgi:hypothetical protein
MKWFAKWPSPLSRRDRATRLASCGFSGRSHHSLGSSQVPVFRMIVFASRQLSLKHETVFIIYKFLLSHGWEARQAASDQSMGWCSERKRIDLESNAAKPKRIRPRASGIKTALGLITARPHPRLHIHSRASIQQKQQARRGNSIASCRNSLHFQHHSSNA